MQELIGRQFGSYQIQSHLAKGGMANIYLASHAQTEGEALVAIKVVHTSAAESCERFRREMKALCALHHDHILPGLGCGEQDGWCYLVTPYIEGGTLTHRLDHGPLSLQEATELFLQLADALHYAHEQGVVHRDIKSANVLLQDEHSAYLADFGLVRSIELDAHMTPSGHLMGTPEYMAPELVEEEASPRSDIYALGILLYQMLTGRFPFHGGSSIQICLKHIQQLPLPPSVLNPAIPLEVESVVLRALAKDPAERYQSAQDFKSAYQDAWAQANEWSLENAQAAAHLLSITLPIPQVRLVEARGRQPLAATLLGRRKPLRGFLALVVVLVLLLLSLPSIARQTGLVPLTVGPPTQVVRVPTSVAVSKPLATAQPNGESLRGNGKDARGAVLGFPNSDEGRGKGSGQVRKHDD